MSASSGASGHAAICERDCASCSESVSGSGMIVLPRTMLKQPLLMMGRHSDERADFRGFLPTAALRHLEQNHLLTMHTGTIKLLVFTLMLSRVNHFFLVHINLFQDPVGHHFGNPLIKNI